MEAPLVGSATLARQTGAQIAAVVSRRPQTLIAPLGASRSRRI
jgi:hypothetical protein